MNDAFSGRTCTLRREYRSWCLSRDEPGGCGRIDLAADNRFHCRSAQYSAGSLASSESHAPALAALKVVRAGAHRAL